MARNANAARRSDFYEASNAFVRAQAWRDMQIRDAYDTVNMFFADRDKRLVEYSASVERVAQDMIGLIIGRQEFDTDDAIEVFQAQERDFVKERDKLAKEVDEVLRKTGRKAPDTIAFHNYVKKEFVKRFNAAARVNRDARWRVMAARAEHMPSAGTGPIHGRGGAPE